MIVDAVRGALGFLSRLPVGHDAEGWAAVRETPAAFPLAGYLIGALLAVPLLVPLPAPTVAVAFVAWVYLVTGITHVDGVTDLGDAMVVHGDATARREVMKDTTVGVGGALAVALVVFGLGTAGLELAALDPTAMGLVVVAEVGAKLGVATVVCLGTATHEGLGSDLTERATPASLALPTALAVPAVLLGWPTLLAAGATLIGALAATGLVYWWARTRLGGVSGDVMGASNELARIAALHVGVIAWTHW